MNNYKERLFKLIREEKVVIFAGAGLSLYAGYPSGKELTKLFYSELNPSEKEYIEPNLNLTDITEEIYRSRGNNRNELIQTLKSVFNLPSKNEPITHKILSTIPHFKTIITTNYDSLIEESYKSKGQVIFNELQIPLLEKNKTHIFKIHGDLSKPESIILTRSDYNNFFKNESQNNNLWSVIKERFLTKNILFLGYNLEDPNVSMVFEKITDNLKSFRKEAFLVAPNLPPQKVSHLSHQKINYIDGKAGELFDELIIELKSNIITDLEKGVIGADTFKSFLINHNLLPELEAKIDSYKLKSLKGINGEIEGKLNLTFNKNDETVEEFRKYIDGRKFGEFSLTDKELKSVDIGWGGLKFPQLKNGSFKLTFLDKPKFDTKVDLKFSDGFLYEDLEIKGYGSKNKIEFIPEIKSANITISIDPDTFPNPQCNFNYEHKEICSKIHQEVKFFDLLYRFCSGMEFTIIKDSRIVSKQKGIRFEPLINDSDFYRRYFQNLLKIQDYFDVIFYEVDFKSIDNKKFNTVNNVVNIIDKGFMEITFENNAILEINEIDDSIIEILENINNTNHKFQSPTEEIEEFLELHNQRFNLGHKTVEIDEPFVLNLEDIKNGKTKTVIIESKTKSARIYYFEENLTST